MNFPTLTPSHANIELCDASFSSRLPISYAKTDLHYGLEGKKLSSCIFPPAVSNRERRKTANRKR